MIEGVVDDCGLHVAEWPVEIRAPRRSEADDRQALPARRPAVAAHSAGRRVSALPGVHRIPTCACSRPFRPARLWASHSRKPSRRPRNPRPADRPLTAGLRRPTPRLLAHLKQLPRLARHLGRKPKQIVQLPRPIPAAPVDLFAVADPQEGFELSEGVFEKIRRILLGGFCGSYRRARPGYSLGSHFCAGPSKVCARTWLDGWGAANTLAVAF